MVPLFVLVVNLKGRALAWLRFAVIAGQRFNVEAIFVSPGGLLVTQEFGQTDELHAKPLVIDLGASLVALPELHAVDSVSTWIFRGSLPIPTTKSGCRKSSA